MEKKIVQFLFFFSEELLSVHGFILVSIYAPTKAGSISVLKMCLFHYVMCRSQNEVGHAGSLFIWLMTLII